MTALSLAVVAQELGRLGQVYTRPAALPEDPRALASLYLGVFAMSPPVTAEQLVAAVSAYLASDERFHPKPGQLKALARVQRVGVVHADDLPSRYAQWERLADDVVDGVTPCPVCLARFGAQLVAVRPDGSAVYRLECWHIDQLHVTAGIPYSGRRRHADDVARLETKLANEQRVADDIAAGRAVILRTGAVRYLARPTGQPG
jgi:hypothetical protein